MYVIVPTDSKTPQHVFVIPANCCRNLPEVFDIYVVKVELLELLNEADITKRLYFSEEFPGQGIKIPCRVRKDGQEIYFSTTQPKRLVSMRFSSAHVDEIMTSVSG